MSLTISIPDGFADVLGVSAEERDRKAREALALELYREGKISLRRMGELAGVGGDYWAAENFRALHRLFVSGSDRAAERWKECHRIPGAEALELHQLCRAMVFLGAPIGGPGSLGSPRCVKDQIEEALF